jgi:hypothetical protein
MKMRGPANEQPDGLAEVLSTSKPESDNENQEDADQSMRMCGHLTQVQFSNPRYGARPPNQKPESDLEDDTAIEEKGKKATGSNKIARPPETAPSSEMQRIQKGKKNEKISLMKGMLYGLDKSDKNRPSNAQVQNA